MNSKFSNFTDIQIAAAEQDVVDAQAYYNERLDAYDRAIKSAGRRWADKFKLPLVNKAKEALYIAKETLDSMLKMTTNSQNIELVDIVTGQVKNPDTETSMSWGTIGFLGIGLIIIVIFYYIIYYGQD